MCLKQYREFTVLYVSINYNQYYFEKNKSDYLLKIYKLIYYLKHHDYWNRNMNQHACKKQFIITKIRPIHNEKKIKI